MVTICVAVQAMTFHPGDGNSQKRKKAPLLHEAWGGFNSNTLIDAAKQCIKPDSVPPASPDISKACAQHSGASQSENGSSSIPVSGMADCAGSTSAPAKSAAASSPAIICRSAVQQRAKPYEGLLHSNADMGASAASCLGAATASARLAASSGSDVAAEQVLDLPLERDGTVVGQSSAVLPSSKAASPQASSTLLASLMQPSTKVAANASQHCSEATAAALSMGHSKANGMAYHQRSPAATHTGNCSVGRTEEGRGHGLGTGHASDSHKFLALLAGG